MRQHVPRLIAMMSVGAALPALAAAEQPGLEVGFGDQGLMRLSYAAECFLQDGTFRVWGAAFQTWNGERRTADLSREARRFDLATRQLTLDYPWGEIRCSYGVRPAELALNDYANLKELGTPDVVRRMYPDAFSFVYVGHGNPTPVRAQLVDAVRHGDILVVHGWYNSPTHPIVRGIYAEAGK